MEELETLKRRLSKIGIDIEYAFNYPWIYLHKINGVLVDEKFLSDYGFTIAFYKRDFCRPIDIEKTFETIRKYL